MIQLDTNACMCMHGAGQNAHRVLLPSAGSWLYPAAGPCRQWGFLNTQPTGCCRLRSEKSQHDGQILVDCRYGRVDEVVCQHVNVLPLHSDFVSFQQPLVPGDSKLSNSSPRLPHFLPPVSLRCEYPMTEHESTLSSGSPSPPR